MAAKTQIKKQDLLEDINTCSKAINALGPGTKGLKALDKASKKLEASLNGTSVSKKSKHKAVDKSKAKGKGKSKNKHLSKRKHTTKGKGHRKSSSKSKSNKLTKDDIMKMDRDYNAVMDSRPIVYKTREQMDRGQFFDPNKGYEEAGNIHNGPVQQNAAKRADTNLADFRDPNTGKALDPTMGRYYAQPSIPSPNGDPHQYYFNDLKAAEAESDLNHYEHPNDPRYDGLLIDLRHPVENKQNQGLLQQRANQGVQSNLTPINIATTDPSLAQANQATQSGPQFGAQLIDNQERPSASLSFSYERIFVNVYFWNICEESFFA